MDWVRLAVSTDETRTSLSRVRVRDGWAESTDAYRIHRAPVDGFMPGQFDKSGTRASDEVRMPPFDQLIPRDPPTHTVGDLGEFAAIVAAAVAYGKRSDHPGLVTWTIQGDYVSVSAQFVADALRILPQRWTSFDMYATGGSHPVRLDMPGGAVAVLMPTRTAPDTRRHRFDVSDCMVPFATGVESAA
jgi:hypothetical protein